MGEFQKLFYLLLVFSVMGCSSQSPQTIPQISIGNYDSSLANGVFADNQSIVFNGEFDNRTPCYDIAPSVEMSSENITFTMTMMSVVGPGGACAQSVNNNSVKVSYGPLSSGKYTVFVKKDYPKSGMASEVSGPYEVDIQ